METLANINGNANSNFNNMEKTTISCVLRLVAIWV